jgi:thiol-disulfide isomerase/thioredoxin
VLTVGPRPDAKARRFASIVATIATIAIVGGVAFAVTRAIHHDANAPTVVLPAASTSVGPGATAPVNFSLPALSGGADVSLAKQLAGRPAVVNFFASWCTVCRQELPDFARASSGYGQKVAFVGIDTYDSDPRAALRLAVGFGVRYPLLNDTSKETVKNAYGVGNGLPATFVLDRNGRVRWEILGAVSRAKLASELAPLLAPSPR